MIPNLTFNLPVINMALCQSFCAYNPILMNNKLVLKWT
jgi:hypothetical protein